MGLLHEIQESVVKEGANLGSVLLKLQLLASRLGCDRLEEWVQHESEGYPNDIELPPYRLVGVSYRGTFTGPFGTGRKNAPIPQYIIKEHAGDKWMRIEIRWSIAAIDELLKSIAEKENSLYIDSSNLILLLQGKIYEDLACNEVRGILSRTSLTEIQQSVRSRILKLTLELEKNILESTEITFGVPDQKISSLSAEKVERLSQQIIYGNVTTITGGSASSFNVSIVERDNKTLIEALIGAGIPREDASDLAEIMASEEPSSTEEPFGEKAKKWLGDNLKKAAKGSWGVGITVASKVLSEAALKYYGL